MMRILAMTGISVALVGLGAVGATVASDTMGLSARVESLEPDGSWRTVATPKAFGEAGPIDSASPEPRIVVANKQPKIAHVTVDVTYYNGGTFQVLREEWTLKPFETRRERFDVPDSAYYPPDYRGPPHEGVLVYVLVDDLRLSLNVMRE